MTDRSVESFKTKLDSQHAWPSLYMFKFIVPKGKEADIFMLFPKSLPITKASKAGNFISITVKMIMKSSDEVIDIYQRAHHVEGVIAL